MRELLDRTIEPAVVYHHRWRKGDVLIIDNRATMHRAHGDYDRSENRVLWRIIVEGTGPGSSERACFARPASRLTTPRAPPTLSPPLRRRRCRRCATPASTPSSPS